MKCYLLANLSDSVLNFPKELLDETKYYPLKNERKPSCCLTGIFYVSYS